MQNDTGLILQTSDKLIQLFFGEVPTEKVIASLEQLAITKGCD